MTHMFENTTRGHTPVSRPRPTTCALGSEDPKPVMGTCFPGQKRAAFPLGKVSLWKLRTYHPFPKGQEMPTPGHSTRPWLI